LDIGTAARVDQLLAGGNVYLGSGTLRISSGGRYVKSAGVLQCDDFTTQGTGTFLHGSGNVTCASLSISGTSHYSLTADAQTYVGENYVLGANAFYWEPGNTRHPRLIMTSTGYVLGNQSDADVYDLEISSTGDVTAAAALQVAGNLIVDGGGGELDMSGYNLYVAGNLLNGGNLRLVGSEILGVQVMDGSAGNTTYYGSSSYSIQNTTSSMNFYNLCFENGTYTAAEDIYVNNALTFSSFTFANGNIIAGNVNISSGTITMKNSSSITAFGNNVLISGGSWTMMDDATLATNASLTISTSNWTASGNTTVSMTGIGNLSVASSESLDNLEVASTAVTSLDSNLSATGNFVILSAGNFIANVYDIACGDNFSLGQLAFFSKNTGTLNCGGDLSIDQQGSFSNGAGNLTCDGNLSIGPQAVFTKNSGELSCGGNFSIDPLGAYTNGAGNLTLNGNLSIAQGGVFTKGSGNLILDGNIFLSDANNIPGLNDLGDVVVTSGSRAIMTDSIVMSQLDLRGILDINDQERLIISGALLNSGVLRLTGSEIFGITTMDTDSGNVELYGTGISIGLFTPSEYYNLDITGTGDYEIDGGTDLAVNGNLALRSGNLSLNGRILTVTGSTLLASGAGFANAAGTLRFDGSQASTFTDERSPTATLGNVFIVADSGVTFSTSLTLENLTLSLDATFVGNGIDVRVNTSVSNEGILYLTPGNLLQIAGMATDSGAVRFTGGGVITSPTNYYNLDLDSGTYYLGGNVSVFGNLTMDAGATLAVNGYTLDIRGDLNMDESGETLAVGDGFLNAGNILISNSGAHLTLGQGNIDCSDFSSSGYLTCTADGEINSSGDFTVQAGASLSAGNSTLRMSGTDKNLLISSGNGLHNLDIGGTIEATGSALTLSGNFSITSGTFEHNTAISDLTFTVGGNLSISSGAIYSKGLGDLVLSGTNAVLSDASAPVQNLGDVIVSGNLTLASSSQCDSLSVGVGASLDLVGFDYSVVNVLSNLGTILLHGSQALNIGTTDSDSGIFKFDAPVGASLDSDIPQTYYNVEFYSGNYILDMALMRAYGNVSLTGSGAQLELGVASSGNVLNARNKVLIGAGCLLIDEGTLSGGPDITLYSGATIVHGNGLLSAGNVNLIGGTYTCTGASNITIAGGLGLAGGVAWSAGTSLVHMTGSGNIDAAQFLNDLTVNSSSGTVKISGNNLGVGGEYLVSRGTFDMNDLALTLGGNLTVAASGTLTDSGAGGTGNLIFSDGNNLLTINGSHLVRNVQVAAGTNVELATAFSITSILDLDGDIVTAGSNLSVGGTVFNDGRLYLVGSEVAAIPNMDIDSGWVYYTGMGGPYAISGTGNLYRYANVNFDGGVFSLTSDTAVYVHLGLDQGSLNLSGSTLALGNSFVHSAGNLIIGSGNLDAGPDINLTFATAGNT
ncbi:MAG: hypothetical protein HQL31_07850, partial [Planctomycetes bacterium]|nr:hypothetical protein [Planctomycetota bacterium]